MSLEELRDGIIACIQDRMPESDSLDYKATLNIRTQSERIELAKDMSSFANELGGTIIYGVPEKEENGVPVPMPLQDCGIQIDPGLTEQAENILLDSIRPVLPNIFVKTVDVPGAKGKHLVVVHHPVSWNKPHMVEAYNVRRYFRRGNYRAVLMSEREIEGSICIATLNAVFSG
jgi:predicted HTH transcriptional regulator